MDVAEIRLRKKVLETEIYKLVHQFEVETEMSIDRIGIIHGLKPYLHNVNHIEKISSVEISLEFK